MLNVGRELEFKYDVRAILKRDNIDEKKEAPFIATLFSRGSRMDIPTAEKYVEEKFKEGLFSEDSYEEILKLLKRYRKWR